MEVHPAYASQLVGAGSSFVMNCTGSDFKIVSERNVWSFANFLGKILPLFAKSSRELIQNGEVKSKRVFAL